MPQNGQVGQVVQGPDGKVIQFPAGMSDDQVHQTMQTIYRPGVPDPRGAVQPQYQDVMTGKPGDAATAQGTGAMKGLTGDAAAIFGLLSKVPGLSQFFDQKKLAEMQEFSKAANPAESFGKGAEQVGEMVAGPEAVGKLAGKAALRGGEVISGASKYAQLPKDAELLSKVGGAITSVAPAAKVASRAAATGAINKAQGGDFTTGAAMSAGGDLLAGLGGVMKGRAAMREAPDELTQAQSLMKDTVKNLKNYKNADLKNAVTSFNDAVKSAKNTDEAIAAVEEVHQSLRSLSPGMAEKTGGLYNQLMDSLQGSIGEAGGKAYSKADHLAEILKRHAIYSGAGAMGGGMFGHSPAERLQNALLMGAAGWATPSVMRQVPNALTAMPPVMRSAPAVTRVVTQP